MDQIQIIHQILTWETRNTKKKKKNTFFFQEQWISL